MGLGDRYEDGAEQPAATDAGVRAAETPLYVAGVGASAGGLEALERLFKAMPPDTGIAFVVIQHLSPDFKSLMDELLARHTSMPIHRVENGMAVEANHIYLMPPKKEMIISGGRLLLTDKDPGQDLTLPIDHFFRSLAQDAGPRAIAVVLSGTGSDGSRGIRDVHEAGGLVIAQSEETAKFDGMPRSAIDTGVVDCVLPPEEMPRTLAEYASRPHPAGVCGESSQTGVGAVQGMDAVFKLLRDEYGIDFSYYKPNTVARRIERRLSLNQSLDLEDYIERLARDPGELNSLYRDLLIGVTRFFRAGSAGIGPRHSESAAEIRAIGLEAENVISLPAMKGNRESCESLQGGSGIDTVGSVPLCGEAVSLLDNRVVPVEAGCRHAGRTTSQGR